MFNSPAATSRHLVLGFLAALTCLMPACSRSMIEAPLDETIIDRTELGEMDFWHSLPGRSAVSNSEGFHGVLLLLQGQDPTESYDERLGVLKDLGWINEGFEERGQVAMQRGTLAKVLCHALEIDGGVMMRLTNKSPRYSMRELAYLQIMPQATENQVISGLDYVGVISKAQDYGMIREARRRAKVNPAAVPPPIPAKDPGAVPMPTPPDAGPVDDAPADAPPSEVPASSES